MDQMPVWLKLSWVVIVVFLAIVLFVFWLLGFSQLPFPV